MGSDGWRLVAESTRRIYLSKLKEWGYFPKGGGDIYGGVQWSSYGERTSYISIQVNTSATVPHIRFMYRTRDWWEKSEDAWVSRDYTFNLESKPCRYGGKKWFVRCGLSKNGVYCGRLARVLYSMNGWYGCRHCGNITYQRSNYSGRYRGFISIADLEDQEEKVRRQFYRGLPTRKYRRLLKMERLFERGFLGTFLLNKELQLMGPSANKSRHRTGL